MSARIQNIGYSGLEFYRSFERWLRGDRQRLTRLIIVSAVFIICAILLPLIRGRDIWIPLVAVLSISALIIYLRWPPLGLLTLLFMSLFVKIEVGGTVAPGIHLPLLLMPLLLVIWLVDKVMRQRNLEFAPSRAQSVLIGFALAAVISFAIGQFPWFVYANSAPITSQLAGLAIMVLSVAAFILSANLLTELKWLKRLTWFFLLLGSLFIVARIFPGLGLFLITFFPRGVGGSLFWTWMATVAVSQALLNQSLSRFWRVFLIVFSAALFYGVIVLTYNWKSGWIPPLVVAAVIVCLRYPRLGVAFGLVGLIFLRELPSQVIASDEYSYSTRLEAWRIVLSEIVRVNPIFGLGPSNYYYYTPLFPILGYSVEFNSHNNYVDLLAQTGVLGLVLFLWFAWEMARVAWRLWKELPPGFAKAYAGGVLAGLAGTLVAGMLGDWVIPFVYNIGLRGFRASMLAWIFMGGLVAIDWMHKKSKQTERTTS